MVLHLCPSQLLVCRCGNDDLAFCLRSCWTERLQVWKQVYERDEAVGGLNTEIKLFCHYVDQLIIVKTFYERNEEILKRGSCIIDLTVIRMKKN